jgi:hypothetical protein
MTEHIYIGRTYAAHPQYHQPAVNHTFLFPHNLYPPKISRKIMPRILTRTLVLFPFLALSEIINAPENVTLIRTENWDRNPSCAFSADFTNGPNTTSALVLSYVNSPFENLGDAKSRTCHLLVEIAFPGKDNTVAVREVKFGGKLNVDSGVGIDVKAVWEMRTGLVSFISTIFQAYRWTFMD